PSQVLFEINSVLFGLRKKEKGLESILVKYFTEPYSGQRRKILDRKKNGQPYADGRGRYVPDYPETASVVLLRKEDIEQLLPKLGETDDEVLANIRKLYKAITQPNS